ncbi:hypothetical protein ANACAC_03261 [Anaerostipes caccae L1-92]|uniref:Uncharacterized protein n=1 Tax=Anaerostipes caccae (strain DSM 14662 / CCUG 47493 / JCM 13470 / NCIMB 13811 / L1-92) TaxID=411490 RepID=B0MH24_ANACD|nr:hypothetical protein ANACAC_03261 [Anaerostipes caccae L1-92]
MKDSSAPNSAHIYINKFYHSSGPKANKKTPKAMLLRKSS